MNAIRRHYIFAVFTAITLAVTAALMTFLSWSHALLIGFDTGAIAFLALLVTQIAKDDAGQMRSRAQGNEPDHFSLVGIGLLIVGVVLTAVTLELLQKKAGDNSGILLAAITLTIAWVFSNAIFTLHYAHVYYLPKPGKGARKDRAGLDFPGENPTPDYWDFAYFSFVIGMTFQVSDVTISDRKLRHVALFHAILAFFFNIVVLALTVSLIGSALGG